MSKSEFVHVNWISESPTKLVEFQLKNGPWPKKWFASNCSRGPHEDGNETLVEVKRLLNHL